MKTAKPAHTMKNFFNYLLSTFGFMGVHDLFNSLCHVNFLKITIPLSFLMAIVEKYFGLDFVVMIGFMSVLVLELWTGIAASRIKNQKFTSVRLSRFFFKVAAWLNVLFILTVFKLQFETKHPIVSIAYGGLHTMVIIYVTFEYLISILENIAVLSGKSNKSLIRIINKLLSSMLNLNGKNKS